MSYSWATDHAGSDPAATLAAATGVFSFDRDPRRLSAVLLRERLVRINHLRKTELSLGKARPLGSSVVILIHQPEESPQ